MASAYTTIAGISLVALAVGLSALTGLGDSIRNRPEESVSSPDRDLAEEIDRRAAVSRIAESGILNAPTGAIVLSVEPGEISAATPIIERFGERVVFGVAIRGCGLGPEPLGAAREIDDRFPRIGKFLDCEDGLVGSLDLRTGRLASDVRQVRAARIAASADSAACDMPALAEALAVSSAVLVKPSMLLGGKCAVSFGDVVSHAETDAARRGKLKLSRNELAETWRAGAKGSPAYMRAVDALVENAPAPADELSRL